MRYRNPVIPGFHPDPSICRVGSDYYLVTSTFEYFPGVPIFHSTDLVHWRQIGYCLTRDSQLPLKTAGSSGGIYAPTIRWRDGTFYMVVTNVSGMGHFYVTAQRAEGPWSDPILVRANGLPAEGIDPSLFFDDDGVVYFSCNAGMSTIDIETGSLRSDLKHVWTGSGGRYAEAPHLYKINGLYYYLLAEGGTEAGHMVTIARSVSPWGPYEACPHNPILTHRDRGEGSVQSTGHADLIEAHDGSWWAVFLATRVSAKYPNVHHLGRETFLAPVTWDSEGWPLIGNQGVVDLEMPAPSFMIASEQDQEATSCDDFDTDTLALPWNFRRNPNPGDWSLSERPGSLTLKCIPVTLNDAAPLAFVGRRQEHFRCRFSACIAFDPRTATEEAGLTVIMNEEHHYEIFVRGNDGGERTVAVRRRIGDLVAVVAEDLLGDGDVILSIDASPEEYHFGCKVRNGDQKTIASGATRYLSTEVAGGFTGAYIGMYATSNHHESTAFAHFDWAEYTFE
ncbi:MAG: glycoside hydrolase family 43 protein [Capsulimonas sp.]|uniref:glycoside hydrolase family 43 protein n=1 Tax=Capsulimonas sp. TaxID=2494211 RepID=UPI003264F747